jgi:hypothetical protein
MTLVLNESAYNCEHVAMRPGCMGIMESVNSALGGKHILIWAQRAYEQRQIVCSHTNTTAGESAADNPSKQLLPRTPASHPPRRRGSLSRLMPQPSKFTNTYIMMQKDNSPPGCHRHGVRRHPREGCG